MDAGATRGSGGVEGTTWGAVDVVGAARGAAKVREAGDRGVAQGQAVKPPRVAAGPPAPIPWVV
jgi:hypothetical protein